MVTALPPLLPAQRERAPASVSLPALIESGWRLDYVTRTSASGKVNAAQYILRLVSQDAATGEVTSLEVAASKQQVAALHAAVTQALGAADAFLPRRSKRAAKA